MFSPLTRCLSVIGEGVVLCRYYIHFEARIDVLLMVRHQISEGDRRLDYLRIRIKRTLNSLKMEIEMGLINGRKVPRSVNWGKISSLRSARMAGYPAAWQHEIFCACRNFRAVCARSTKNQFTVWARSRRWIGRSFAGFSHSLNGSCC
jgi:hypothetical protein